MLDRRVIARPGLGDFDIAQGIFQVIGTGIQAAGSVGAAAINADATKYVSRENVKANLIDTLSNERVALANLQAQTTQTQIQSGATTKQVGFGSVALVALGLAAVFAIGRA